MEPIEEQKLPLLSSHDDLIETKLLIGSIIIKFLCIGSHPCV